MNLIEIEDQFKKQVDIDYYIKKLEDGFKKILSNPEHDDIRSDMEKLSNGEPVSLRFAGFIIMLLTPGRKTPFFRTKADVFIPSRKPAIAWYEIEYGPDGMVLDDYLDFYYRKN